MGLFRLLGADGQPVEVEADAAVHGLADGSLRAGAPVRLRSVDGRTFEAAPDRISELLQSGDFELDTPEAARSRRLERDYGGTGGEAAAAGLGAARGATLGLSDVAAGGLGFGEDVAAYQEVNPTASMVGEVGGTLGSLLLPGLGAARGASMGARGLRAVTAPARGLAMLSEGAGAAVTRGLAAGEAGLGRRLLARTAGTATEGAIEGAAVEGAHILSEAALGQEPDVTAESVIARLGTGALYGGAAGGLLGGSFGAVGEAGRGTLRLGREGVEAIARGWQQRTGTELAPGVADLLGEGIGRTGALIAGVDSDAAAAFTRLGPEGQAARRIVEEGPEATYDVGTRRLGSALDGIFRHLDPVLDQAIGSRKIDDVMRVVRRDALPDQISAADGALRRVRELAADIETNLDVYGGAPSGAAAARRRMMQAADGAERRIQDAVQAGGEPASVAARIFSELDGLKRAVGSSRRGVRSSYARQAIDGLYERELRDTLENEEIWGSGIRGLQAETNAGWHRYLNWDEDFGRQFARAGEADGFDRLRASDSAKVNGFLQQIGAASNDSRAQIFDDWLRGTSDLTETIGRHYELTPAARASLEELRAATAAAREAYGEVANRARVLNQWRMISGGSQSSLAAALGGGAGAAFALGGGAAALPLGLAAAGVSAISNPARTARMLMTVERLSRQTGDRVRQSIRGFLRGSREVAIEGARRGRRAAVASTAAGITSAYRERSARLDEQSRDPAALAARMTQSTAELTRGAPQVQQALQMAGVRGQQYLAQQRPASRMLPGQLLPTQTTPPRDAMERWLRQARIVDDPMSALRALEARELTREEVDALRVVYPALYRQVVAAAMESLTEHGKEPSYQDRIQLGLLLGIPTDPSLTPQSLATIQAAHAATFAPNQQSPAPTQRAPDIAGGLASGTQQLEMRRA